MASVRENCAGCGAEIAADAGFCSRCGAPAGQAPFATRTVAATSPAPAHSSSRPRSSSLWSSPASAPAESRFLPGTVLADRYRIVALLGKGGMGEVYRADDLALGQAVALKFLPEALSKNAGALTRFRNEVRIARQVSHPNVCRVYDVGEVDGQVFLSMEYVDGEDLGSLLRRIGRLPSDKAAEIARKLCAGLAAAHGKGVLHRDLKPGNVMLDGRGQVLLTDFGLAALAGGIDAAEIRSGTPAYMAPEQLEGREVTEKSDIYSLGLVLYEIFTGKRPYESDTLAGLVELRKQAPPTPSSVIHNIEPAAERIILRCLAPDPRDRPASALSVAAALPGGDPLEAALAAGETPSPQMVAAAGEGHGLRPLAALALWAAVLAGAIAIAVFLSREGALERMRPELPPEVLAHRARVLLARAGYPDRPADSAHGFYWDNTYLRWARRNGKPAPDWDEILKGRPSVLAFWYRQSPQPLRATDFHNDLLTAGIVNDEDPPLALSGMASLKLDPSGRLLDLEAIPPQRLPPLAAPAPPANWAPLFEAAEIDPATLQSAEPLWTWRATSDERAAWTGTWPGTSRPLRVEAAALRGKPVAFALKGPWSEPDRMPDSQDSPKERAKTAALLGLVLLVLGVAAVVSRRNVIQGKGDRKGAFRLASAVFCALILLTVLQMHLSASLAPALALLIGTATALGWTVVIWMFYMAVEPFVRRHWPQSMISWSSVMAGRPGDPVVGRDVLIGACLGLVLRILDITLPRLLGENDGPGLASPTLLDGARSTLGGVTATAVYGVRSALMFFLILFVARVLVRKQWLAALVFALFWTGFNAAASQMGPLGLVVNFAVFVGIALVAVRFGLLTLASFMFVANLIMRPGALQPSAWYFTNSLLVIAIVVGLSTWAAYRAIGGRQILRQDFFG